MYAKQEIIRNFGVVVPTDKAKIGVHSVEPVDQRRSREIQREYLIPRSSRKLREDPQQY